MPASPGKRVAIVLLTGIGDVVHGLPIASALKRSSLASHITWIAEPVPSWVVRQHAAVDEVIVFHKQRGWRGVQQLRRELRDQQFDITLNLNVYFKSVWPTAFTGAARRVGFDRRRCHEGVWLFANQHLPPNPRAHTQDMFLEFLDVLGLNGAAERQRGLDWQLEFTPAERAAQHAFFGPLRARPVAAIVPASANPKKDWPVERYAPVIDALQRDRGARTLLVGGPSAREAELCRQIVARAKQPPVVALGDDVRRMMWLVAGSDLVIAPDTGPVHIARACNVPVIGLYGHTNPWRVGPYRKYEDLWIDRYTDGSPDASNARPKLDRMELITEGDVLAAVERAFRHYGVASRAGRPA
jgi:heptosyltransferase I